MGHGRALAVDARQHPDAFRIRQARIEDAHQRVRGDPQDVAHRRDAADGASASAAVVGGVGGGGFR